MPKTEEDFIPAAVKKQEEKAKAAQKKAQDAKKPVKPEPAPAPEPAPEPAPVAEPAVPAEAAPAAEVPKPDSGFEHKYSVLQGMYNTDTQELKGQIQAMMATAENQQKIIDNLNNVLTALPKQTAPAEVAPAVDMPELNKDDFSGYGGEMVGVINSIKILSKRIAALESRNPSDAPVSDPGLTDRVNRIEQTQVMTVKEAFYDALNKAIPTWGVQNNDPKFLAWLNETDPMSSVQRKVLIEHAFKQWNHKQVIAIFKAFAMENIDPSAPAEQPGLESQIVPDTTGDATGGPGGKPPVQFKTVEDFTKAQDDFVKGRITEADFDKIANSYQQGLAAAPKQ